MLINIKKISIFKIKNTMAKKRKLNSKNPKYFAKTADNTPKVKERRLMCNAPVRNTNGELVEGTTIPIYGVWYEND